jgi:hypothetical protein
MLGAGVGVGGAIRVLGLDLDLWNCRGRGAGREEGEGRCIVGGRLERGMGLGLGSWGMSRDERGDGCKGMRVDVAAQAREVRQGVRSVLGFRGLCLYCTTQTKKSAI